MSADIDLNELYAPEWLLVQDFPEQGVTATITEVKVGKNLDQEDAVIIRLSCPELNGKWTNGRTRDLNGKQANALKKLFGGTSQWTGQRVFVRPEPYNATTDTLVYLRPSTPPPAAQPTAAATPPEEPPATPVDELDVPPAEPGDEELPQ